MSVPYGKILMTVDGSFNAEAAARYALLLARACEAELFLLAVVDRKHPATNHEAVQGSLDRLTDTGKALGLTMEPLIRSGELISVVAGLVKAANIDLVMAAARHADVSWRFFVATAGSRLMANLTISVIVIRVVNPGKLAWPQWFLVPIRGGDSRYFPEKAYLVSRLATYCQAQVKVLQVRKLKKAFFKGESWLSPDTLEARARFEVEAFEQLLKAQGLEPHRRIVAAPEVAEAILVEAASRHHDLIIAGADQRDWMARLLSQSPVENLMARTPCDLLVLRKA